MPPRPTLSVPQTLRIETTHDHPLAIAPPSEHAQQGAVPAPALHRELDEPADLEVEAFLDYIGQMIAQERAAGGPPTSPTARTVDSRARSAVSPRRPTRTVPDPVIAAPRVPTATMPPSTNGPQRRLSLAGKVLAFFGYGRNNKARKELVTVIWALILDLSQIISIITLLAISTHHQSRTDPSKNEWDACGKPLGTWNALWVVRLFLDVWLSVWRWSRERTKRLRDEIHGVVSPDAEAQTQGIPNAAPPGGRRAGTAAQRAATAVAEGQVPVDQTPYPRVYARLSLIGSTFTLVWFVLSQIFVYSSTHTCRVSSPHLWWLTFGVLCVMYFMILEVVLVAVLVFVVGPILYIFWSIVLLCLGRHPSQNPHHFTPDIGQVPRSVVDRLPLVLYIPPPPDHGSKPVTLPSDLHAYPPKSPSIRRRFFFLPFPRRAAHGGASSKGGGDNEKDPGRPRTWEDNWEKGEYPFVQLDSHRAACAICLLDFEEPKRVGGAARNSTDSTAKVKPEVQVRAETEAPAVEARRMPGALAVEEEDITEQTRVPASPVSPVSPMSPMSPTSQMDITLRLEDAGEGAQPLRLLKCGHVFHKTCVDPWLLDVSGRCPVCQRPVRGGEGEEGADVGQPARPARRRWFRRTRRTVPT